MRSGPGPCRARARWHRSSALCAALVACGCGARAPAVAPPPAPLRPDAAAEQMHVQRSFWIPGEQMRWELSLRGIVGAETVLAVGTPGTFDGRETVIVRSRTESVGVVNAVVDVSADAETWIDLDSALPVLRTTSERVGKRRRHARSRFSAGVLHRTVQRGSGREYSYERKLPEGVALHDLHSMIGILRAWDPKAGSHAYLHSIEDGQVRRHLVRFTRRELVKTAMGRTPALRLDVLVGRGAGGGSGKPYAIWISDDARRLPLLVVVPTRVGTMRVELVSYQAPRR